MTSANTFEFLTIDAPADWEKLRHLCPNMTAWGVKYLAEGLDGHVRTVIIESRYVCKDHRSLHANFYSKKFRIQHAPCARLHFFDRKVSEDADLHNPSSDLLHSYVGYSVIRPVAQRCIGRTVIDPAKIMRGLGDGYYLLRTKFTTHLNGTAYDTAGFPAMSQDGEATVCAHSAMWSVCRYLSERYRSYRETYPYDFVDMISDLSSGRAVPYRGMTYRDYSTILAKFGCHPEVIRTKKTVLDEDIKTDKLFDVCTYVESGFPVLASYHGHVVAIIGHTLAPGMSPEPDEKGLVASTQFLKQFIVVDDNRFPYQLLGRKEDPQNYSKAYSIDSILAVVCPLPEMVFLPASLAHEIGLAALGRLRERTGDEALLCGEAGPLVTRLFLTNSSALQRRRRSKAFDAGVPDMISMMAAELHLPHFVWVMEVAPLALYKSGFCSAEIVIDSTANEREDAILYTRVGASLSWKSGSEAEENSLPGNPSRFRQFTHNLGES